MPNPSFLLPADGDGQVQQLNNNDFVSLKDGVCCVLLACTTCTAGTRAPVDRGVCPCLQDVVYMLLGKHGMRVVIQSAAGKAAAAPIAPVPPRTTPSEARGKSKHDSAKPDCPYVYGRTTHTSFVGEP